MADKIEDVARVALASCDLLKLEGSCHCQNYSESERVRQCLSRARAAIEAMRTLTPELERAVALASCERELNCRRLSVCRDGKHSLSAFDETCLARARRTWQAGWGAASGGVT